MTDKTDESDYDSSWETLDIPHAFENSLTCTVCKDHTVEALSYFLSKCDKARVSTLRPPPILGPVTARLRHYPCSKRGCKKPAAFDIMCGELKGGLRKSDAYATRWLLSRGFDISIGRRKLEPPIAATIVVKGAKIEVTEQQVKMVEKALRQALDREKDEDRRYELAVLIERLIPEQQ